MTKDRTLASALHIMTTLAYNHDQLISSEVIATGMKTNPGLVRRIMSKLSQAGLIETKLGKSGGSQLARAANKIFISEIYLAVREAPLFGGFEKEPLKICRVSCNMGRVLNNLYDDMEAKLLSDMKKKSLSDLVREIK